jgi:hypothetical protein
MVAREVEKERFVFGVFGSDWMDDPIRAPDLEDFDRERAKGVEDTAASTACTARARFLHGVVISGKNGVVQARARLEDRLAVEGDGKIHEPAGPGEADERLE